MSHSAGGGDVQAQGADRLSVWQGPSLWLAAGHRLPVSYMAEGARVLSEVSFYESTKPHHGGSTCTT